MLQGSTSTIVEDVSTICFQTSVPNELEAIFRRGGEWDEGFEFVGALSLQPGSNESDALEFLDLTQQLATSSAFGAVQAAAGPCKQVLRHGGVLDDSQKIVLEQPDFMVLVRFQAKEQLDAFVQCPPVAAVLEGDERSPLKAVWAGVLVVAPAENSQSSPQTGAPRFP